MLVGLVVLEGLDEPVKLLLFAALRERPFSGVGEGADGRKTGLDGFFPVLVF